MVCTLEHGFGISWCAMRARALWAGKRRCHPSARCTSCIKHSQPLPRSSWTSVCCCFTNLLPHSRVWGHLNCAENCPEPNRKGGGNSNTHPNKYILLHLQRHLEGLLTLLIFGGLSLSSKLSEVCPSFPQLDSLEDKSFVLRIILKSHLFWCCQEHWTKNSTCKNTFQLSRTILSSGLLSGLYHSLGVTFLCLFWCSSEDSGFLSVSRSVKSLH